MFHFSSFHKTLLGIILGKIIEKIVKRSTPVSPVFVLFRFLGNMARFSVRKKVLRGRLRVFTFQFLKEKSKLFQIVLAIIHVDESLCHVAQKSKKICEKLPHLLKKLVA